MENNKKSFSIGVQIAKYATALVVVLVLFWFGFTTVVKEGQTAVILRFGAVRSEVTEPGLYFKLPWPFESTVTYDSRLQYLESNRIEAITSDSTNIIIQCYVAWEIADPVLYHNSVGMKGGGAVSNIKDQVFNATNLTIGGYKLSSLVSLQKEEIKIDQIQSEIFARMRETCRNSYGIEIKDVSSAEDEDFRDKRDTFSRMADLKHLAFKHGLFAKHVDECGATIDQLAEILKMKNKNT